MHQRCRKCTLFLREQLASVYDVNQQSAERVASAQGITAARSAEEIFSSTKVDAVLIATSTPTHADYIEMAVAAGKAVLCERPIDLSLARVNACAAKIAGTKVPIQLGFNRRYDPGHSAARKAMAAGEIGRSDLYRATVMREVMSACSASAVLTTVASQRSSGVKTRT